MDTRQILERIKGLKALVIGDPCLDEIVYGRVDIIAKESPVPAILIDEVKYAPGQAANVASNLAALGAKTTLAGLIGGDAAGEKLKAALGERGVRYSLTECSNPTTHRIKYTCREPQRHQQQVFHAYAESREPDEEAAELLLLSLGEDWGLILVSDYGNGAITPPGIAALAEKAKGPVCVAGTARGDLRCYSGFDIIVGNREELDILIERSEPGPDDIETQMRQAQNELGCKYLLITAAADGMYAYGDGVFHREPSRVEYVKDITGAGDTATAAFCAAVAAEVPLSDTTRLASITAAIVVEKPGTEIAIPEEIIGRG
jgi:D-beta-D-heptose 7-phosphate kinase/D-beta-D-heptose 1-phosphate adenosyltransferase